MKGRRHGAQPHCTPTPPSIYYGSNPLNWLVISKEIEFRNVLEITPLVVKDYPIAHYSSWISCRILHVDHFMNTVALLTPLLVKEYLIAHHFSWINVECFISEDAWIQSTQSLWLDLSNWVWVLISKGDKHSGASCQAFYFRGEVSKRPANYPLYGQHSGASTTSHSTIASWTPQSPWSHPSSSHGQDRSGSTYPHLQRPSCQAFYFKIIRS